MQIEAVDDDETFKDVVVFIISHFCVVLCLHGVILIIVRQREFYVYQHGLDSLLLVILIFYGGLKKRRQQISRDER